MTGKAPADHRDRFLEKDGSATQEIEAGIRGGAKVEPGELGFDHGIQRVVPKAIIGWKGLPW